MMILCRLLRAPVALCAVVSFLAFVPACHDDKPTPPDLLPPGCGDGVLDEGEECDQGSANSDTTRDACRTNCRKASCGDHVQDSGEACDDGNAWGGDGCTPLCVV